MAVEIPIAEEFRSATGQFTNYACYDAAQQSQLLKQKHVDIRTCDTSTISIPYTMLALSSLTMAQLDLLTMGMLDGNVLLSAGEQWTGTGSVTSALSPSRNYWRVM